jgi:hypothetical protein
MYNALPGYHDDVCMSLALTNKLFVEVHHKARPRVAFRIGNVGR